MKNRRKLFLALALILSHLGCVHVTYSYCSLRWNVLTALPARFALLLPGVPYAAGVLLCLLLARHFARRAD